MNARSWCHDLVKGVLILELPFLRVKRCCYKHNKIGSESSRCDAKRCDATSLKQIISYSNSTTINNVGTH